MSTSKIEEKKIPYHVFDKTEELFNKRLVKTLTTASYKGCEDGCTETAPKSGSDED
jgi:hypothetical protein